MNTIIFPEDVDNVIQSFFMCNVYRINNGALEILSCRGHYD